MNATSRNLSNVSHLTMFSPKLEAQKASAADCSIVDVDIV